MPTVDRPRRAVAGAPEPCERRGFAALAPGREEDRDSRLLQFLSSKNLTRQSLEPRTPGGHRDTAWGGSVRRVVSYAPAPSRDDEALLAGRYVPVGFGRYLSPVVDANDYEYFRVAGWRVAVPRSTPGIRTKDLLSRIYNYGPQSAGYVRLGDTLVPAILGPGDRATLAGTAVDFEDYPLGP
jgi:hypothetical protein